MNSDRWHRIESLFHSALEREPAARQEFLNENCSDDADLRGQVELLINSYCESGNFIEEAPLAGLAQSVIREHQVYSDSPPLLSGSLIGRYEVQSLLGAGGMGEVYLARDISLARPVALKLLPKRVAANPDQARWLETEAQSASALNHPNIITVYEVGRDGDLHFIATEFIEGTTLRQRIKKSSIALEETLRIIMQMVEALAAAHSAGVVHRDIKPENVMIRPDGLVKVLDFGLAGGSISSSATQAPSSPNATAEAGLLMGTIAYLSPEQVRGEEADCRSDLFSLGVVFYELMRGTRPFTGNGSSAICDAILSSAPDIDSLSAPKELKRILARLLEKNIEQRYQSAFQIREDLKRLNAKTNHAITQRAHTRFWVALALIAGTLVILALFTRFRRLTPTGDASSFATGPVTRITDVPGQEIFPSISPDGTMVVYASMASGSWDIYLKKIGESTSLNLTPEHQYVDLAPAFSPDGKTIAFRSSRDGEGIFLIDIDGSNIRKLTNEGHNPAWSPDSREIVVASDRVFDFEGRNDSSSTLTVVNVATGQRRAIEATDAVQPSWSPHGNRIAYWGVHKGGQRDIWTVSAKGGDPLEVTSDMAVDWDPVWSRDGRFLYFLSNRGGSMNLWRAPIDEITGRLNGPLEPATLPSANSQHLSFSSDGKSLAYVEMNRRENTFSDTLDPTSGTISGQSTQITKGVRRYCAPHLSPDQARLVFSSQGEAREDIYTIGLDGAEPTQLTNDEARDRLPRWSPQGDEIAFMSDRSGNHEIWTVKLDGTGLERVTTYPGYEVTNPVWSPDGSRLLYQVVGLNGFTITRKPDVVRAPQVLKGEQPPWFLPWSWSPDGQQLAGWQLKPEKPDMNLVTYSFSTGQYTPLPIRGQYPIWMNDSRRLIFSTLSKLFLLDTVTMQQKLLKSIEPDHLGTFFLTRDNGRLFYSRISNEADIWLVSLN